MSSIRRSARRAIVRAICVVALCGVPPGSMNWLCFGSCCSIVSICCSRFVVWLLLNGFGCHLLCGSVASAVPMSNRRCCMSVSVVCICLLLGVCAAISPIHEFSSSIVPYASSRAEFFGTRVPPTSDVVPLSPVLVYIFIVLWLFYVVVATSCAAEVSTVVTEGVVFCGKSYLFHCRDDEYVTDDGHCCC